jgi:hypothetical protein
MDTSELVGELLQALTNDVQALRKKVEQLPTGTPPDYGASLAGLTTAVQALRHGPPPAAAPDQSAITARLDRLEQLVRQRPEYKMSRYVQYGGYGFGVLVVLLVVSVWYALSWRSDREAYAQAYTQDHWRVRYTQQANPAYYSFMEGKLANDPGIYNWVVEQEQADEKRALAQKATRQAQALQQQASQLERGKGSKASRR